MSNKTNKGAAKLASVLQSRMVSVNNRMSPISVERGEILSGRKLKLYSVPDSILDKNDYSVCVTIQKTTPIKKGDRVLVVWTLDGEPVVIDKITEADAFF